MRERERGGEGGERERGERERERIDFVYRSSTIKGHNFSFLYPVSNFSNFEHITHL